MAMSRRAFFNYFKDSAEAVAGVSAGLTLVAATGCGPNKKPTKTNGIYNDRPREVRILQHTVRTNESILGLFREELRGARGFGTIPGSTAHDEFVMRGDGPDVHYKFNELGVFREVNRGFGNVTVDTILRQGQTVNFPDFNGNGYIGSRGQSVEPYCGVIIFSGARNSAGNMVSKSMDYHPNTKGCVQ